MRRIPSALAPLVLLLLAVTPSLPPAAGGAPFRVVEVLDFAYRDAATGGPVTVATRGDVVEFRLVDGFHTATRGAASVSLAFLGGPDSPLLTRPGATYTYVVTEHGAIPYTCLVHPQMEGLLLAT